MPIGFMYYPKQQNNIINRVHNSTKLTPVQASLKMKEGYIYNKLLDKGKKKKPKIQVSDLLRTAELKHRFSKRDATNWSYKLYTKIIKYRNN